MDYNLMINEYFMDSIDFCFGDCICCKFCFCKNVSFCWLSTENLKAF